MKTFRKILLLVIFVALQASILYANEEIASDTSKAAKHSEGKFNPGEFMLDHITDAYEWHIITLGHHHVSIPLPILVYSQTSGFHAFMSNKFHHGTQSFQNLKVGTDGKQKGKIIEIGPDGKESLPWDFSLTKVALSLLFSATICLLIFLSVAGKYKTAPGKAPSGLQGAVEPLILFIRDDIAKASIGSKYERYLPFLLTLFFFIWITNTLGLIPIFPGGANVTGNIAVTMVMALFTFAITVASSNKYYWEEIVNTPGVPTWLKLPIPLMPVIELLSFLLKPLILMIRLFANITAGHLVGLGFVSLIFIFGAIHPALGYGVSLFSMAFSIFMGMLELLVAFIQAFVFTLLSAIYFGQAVATHHSEGHH